MSDLPEEVDEWECQPNGPFRDGFLWVLNRKCPTCIFRPGNLMRLREGRVAAMVQHCITNDTVISCHETLDGPRSVCRGLWDAHRKDISILQVAERIDAARFDEPPTERRRV